MGGNRKILSMVLSALSIAMLIPFGVLQTHGSLPTSPRSLTLAGFGGNGFRHTDCSMIATCNSTWGNSNVPNVPGPMSVFEKDAQYLGSNGYNAIRISFNADHNTNSGNYFPTSASNPGGSN